ncbi:MAG: DnaJ domain-containing protein [Deltaproteobacteria bacterium]|nr:DnaJ domain-containing protein [Deltaproteobacteria bacterium]
MSTYPNYYDLLGVAPNAPVMAIRKAYRARMLKLRKHPDLGGSNDGAVLLNEAYAVLKDRERRAAYDRLFLATIAEPLATAKPARAAGRERRRATRVGYAGHVHVRVGRIGVVQPGQCRDLSTGGLCLKTVAALRPGTALGLVFADDPGLMLEGEVRWVRPVPQRFGAILYEGGVEFTDVNLLRFQQFCERLGLQNELAQSPTERSARR